MWSQWGGWRNVGIWFLRHVRAARVRHLIVWSGSRVGISFCLWVRSIGIFHIFRQLTTGTGNHGLGWGDNWHGRCSCIQCCATRRPSGDQRFLVVASFVFPFFLIRSLLRVFQDVSRSFTGRRGASLNQTRDRKASLAVWSSRFRDLECGRWGRGGAILILGGRWNGERRVRGRR